MKDYRVRVGLRDPDSAKYTGDPANWDKAEKACRDAAASLGVPFSEEPGEAAFYGPRSISWSRTCSAANGSSAPCRSITTCRSASTSPTPAPTARNTGPSWSTARPFGSMERFIGCLIEHFAGSFPVWLAPEQVRLLTVTEEQGEYADRLERS